MTEKPVRVRFAPSPTGALHIGGVRTALFNYLFAKKHNGTFILRIEDTDQARFVEGAEKYITDVLDWCNIAADEGPQVGGDFGPYRQSERKESYAKYAAQLVEEGNAYYAFDTPEELEAMRARLKENRILNPQYDALSRTSMKNSLTLSKEEVKALLDAGKPYVIRLKVPEKEEVRLKDRVRGWVMVHTDVLDDKVIMKSDGMPTYHLANVVDDHAMKISHVIRGEEWLPSAPLHILLYQFLGWGEDIPEFAHLPLILKPDGNGKLSKRAAEKAGLPIFPLSWEDPDSSQVSQGFRETGFLPEAMVNFLAFLGWNPGTEQEIFSIDELSSSFSMERINKAGTKFDFEKAKWFNQQYIKNGNLEQQTTELIADLKEHFNVHCTSEKAAKIILLLKERVTFLNEFASKSKILFFPPEVYDEKAVRKKWDDSTAEALNLFIAKLSAVESLVAEEAKTLFWETLEEAGYKPGQYMQMLRVSITGEASGPDLMGMIEILGPSEVVQRMKKAVEVLSKQKGNE
ncbi:MAG: glutamate--tRNA ligase [Bacteroidota bacterium]